MKAIGSSITKGIQVGTRLVCADNTGAKELKMIGVIGFKGRKRRRPEAGVADRIIVSVTKGKPDMKGKVFHAVVIRQRKEFRRPDGTRVMFEDNAAVIVNEKGEPRGTEIKGPVAREVGERFPKIVRIASVVV
ncbi:MAG: 50S ribosomal protein L14 [Candidatus Diapherotrites archaeon]|nr:50S ribosomal protein L14 [Candidatus Diapherotrites archaeon]